MKKEKDILMIDFEKIEKTIKTNLWINYTTLGAMIHNIGLTFVNKEEIDACAYTNGKGIFINKAICATKEFKDLSKNNYLFIVAHELMHILTLTFERKQDRDHQLWNLATDYAINDMLLNNTTTKDKTEQSNPIGAMYYNKDLATKENPKGQVWLYDDKYTGKSAEEIYDDLLEEFKKQHNGKTPQEFDAEIDDAIRDFIDKASKGQKQIGDHKQMDGIDSKDIRRIKTRIQQALENSDKDFTKNSSAFQRAFDYLLKEPKFDWKGFLTNYLKNFIRDDFTWKKPNRRSSALGFILPGINIKASIKLGIAIDTSGSINNEEIEEFLSHISKIMKSFKEYNIDVWCFSTEVHENTLQHYTKHNNNIKTFQLDSFGGTDIACNFKWVKENKKDYDAFICLTDGYDNIDDLQFNSCPVIWGIISNNEFISPNGVKRANTIKIEFDK